MRLVFGVLIWVYGFFLNLRHGLRKWAYRRMGCRIGRNVRLYGGVDGVNPDKISIGDNTVLAVRAQIIAHCPVRGSAPVNIGRNCYIGYAALILPGVTIGDDCIIGAGAIVTRDIPPSSVAVGNPARVIRQRDTKEIARTVARIEAGLPLKG